MAVCSRNVARPVLVVLAMVIALLGFGAPASAHTRLVSTSPADGATVEQPPTSVELTFSEQLISLGSGAELSGSAEQVATTFAVTGTKLVVTAERPLPAGDYTLVWRVTSADGHPVSGTLGFTVSESAGSNATAPATDTPANDTPASDTQPTDPQATGTESTDTESADTESADTESTTSQTQSSPTAASTDAANDGDGGGNPWPWVLVGVLVAAAAGAAAVLAGKRRAGDPRS